MEGECLDIRMLSFDFSESIQGSTIICGLIKLVEHLFGSKVIPKNLILCCDVVIIYSFATQIF